MLKGIDVSSYQPGSYSTSGLSFVFIKVTEGLSYVNPNWAAQRATARAAGLVTGFYHYPHIANSPTAEADYFLSHITLAPGDVLCLDWEWYGQNVTAQQARDYKNTFLARVKQQAPAHKVVLYSDVSNWTTVDRTSNCGDGLWIATAGRPAGDPGIQHPWAFHQYSSSPVDQDVANPNLFPDAAALRAWASSTTSSTGGTTMQLSDVVTLGSWIPKQWPGDTGLQDGKISVNTALGSTYGHARVAHEVSRQILTQVTAMSAAITSLAGMVGSGVDTAAVVTAVQQAIADAVVNVHVDVASPAPAPTPTTTNTTTSTGA